MTRRSSLAETHPGLAAQADGWDPTTLSSGSNKKVSWKCAVGHIWSSNVNNRVKGSGCPFCSGRIPIVGLNDLETTNPILAAQADGWDPSTVSQGSDKRVKWKCNAGHIWQARVSERSSGNGCPVCSGKQVLAGFNDLATKNPELAAQADGWDPKIIVANSRKKVPWKCSLGHKWHATLDNRSRGTGCPVCANREVVVGFNDLATTNPELAAQADGWDPKTVVVFSNKKVRWRCPENHSWVAVISSRSSGSNCPICSGHKVLAGFNDLATVNPELAAQADGWDPNSVTEFSNKKVRWKCELEHTWEATIGDRSGGKGCPVCSGKKVLAGFNDLATKNPELAAQADGWDPSTVTVHTHKRLTWTCSIGHRWKATVKNRSRSGGCPICSNKKLLVGFNDLATTNPELASQAVGWDPKSIFANSNKSFAWRCNLGHEWKATPNNRSGGRGCPSCAEYGFNPSKDGWLYLIENDERQMFQIGISNFLQNRLDKHSNGGWSVVEVRGPMDGLLTQQLEKASLNALRLRGAVIGKRGAVEKFDGHTEAWTKESLTVASLKQILEWVYEDEARVPQ